MKFKKAPGICSCTFPVHAAHRAHGPSISFINIYITLAARWTRKIGTRHVLFRDRTTTFARVSLSLCYLTSVCKYYFRKRRETRSRVLTGLDFPQDPGEIGDNSNSSTRRAEREGTNLLPFRFAGTRRTAVWRLITMTFNRDTRTPRRIINAIALSLQLPRLIGNSTLGARYSRVMQLCGAQCRVSLYAAHIQLVALYSQVCNRARMFTTDIGPRDEEQALFFTATVNYASSGEEKLVPRERATLMFQRI